MKGIAMAFALGFVPPGIGGLSPNEIRTVVMAHTPELRRCYDAERAHIPTLEGQITVGWTIAPDGTVSSTTLVNSTMHNTNVESCVIGVVRTMRFPSNAGPTNVSAYPLRFGVT